MRKLLTISIILILMIGCKKETIYEDVTEIEVNIVYYANKDYYIRVTNNGCQDIELRSDATENPNLVIFEQIGGNTYYWEREYTVKKGNYFIFDGCTSNIRFKIL